ncbi:hypothetical protein QBC44DRAFT_28932 [Cladorrhinum sp. PSN332]|nr:hypothetical protein QBC44DRAFT_28932 [Cladorrhinum sp. PSN332]
MSTVFKAFLTSLHLAALPAGNLGTASKQMALMSKGQPGRFKQAKFPTQPLQAYQLAMAPPLNRVKAVPVDKLVNLQPLNASADEFRKLKPSASGRAYDKVVVGAAIFKNAGTTKTAPPQVLLLKRFANEDYYPNVFELPSGKVDPDDATIKHALFREVHEETGLDVTEILAELEPMIYSTEKTVVNDAGDKVLISKSAIQLNYVVAASDGEVKLAAHEHSESLWAVEGDLAALDITSAMKVVIQEGFKWAADAVEDIC